MEPEIGVYLHLPLCLASLGLWWAPLLKSGAMGPMQLELTPTATTTVTKHKQTPFRAVLCFRWFFTRCFPPLLISGPHDSVVKWHKICRWEHCLTASKLCLFKPVFIQMWILHLWVLCQMHNKKIKHESIFSRNEWMCPDIWGYCTVFCRITCLQSFKPQRDHLASDTV